MNEPRTNYHEGLGASRMHFEVHQEATSTPSSADEHQNYGTLLDEIRAYMDGSVMDTAAVRPEQPATFADVVRDYLINPVTSQEYEADKALGAEIAKHGESATFAGVVRDYFSDSTVTQEFEEEKAYAAALAKETAAAKAEATLIAINRKLMPSLFDPKKGVQNENVTPPVESAHETENVDDSLVWAELGHIKSVTTAVEQQADEELDDSLVWKELGHIKNHNEELALEKADNSLLLQVDTSVAIRGLLRLFGEDPATFKARTLVLDAQKEVPKPSTEDITAQPTDDFDDWKEVLAANEENKKTNREFWAEAALLSTRRAKLAKRVGAAVAAAAVAVMAVPAVGNFIARYAGKSPKNDQSALVRFGSTARLAANAAGALTIPKLEFSTTTSTVLVESGVATVAPAAEIKPSEAAAVSLTALATEAKTKADAEKAEAEAAAAAEAEKNRVKPFEEVMGDLCSSTTVTSEFGWRTDPWPSYHEGIDLGCAQGNEIHAFEDGVVTFAGWAGGYGYMVEIDHGNGRVTRYGHQSVINDEIRVGATVTKGEGLGKVGMTGDATGPHLHFEKRINGVAVNPRG